MPHDITALRYVVLAAGLHSFARAAFSLRVKQATVSRRISALETRIGLTLFERSTRGAIPTVSGQPFIDQAREILSELDRLIASSKAMGSGHVGTLGLGFSTSLSSGNMRAIIVEFLENTPAVRIVGLEGDRDRLVQALHSREIDFAVVSGEISQHGLLRRALWSERVMVVLPESHELARRERIYWTDLRKQRFVIARQDPGQDLADLLAARLGEPGARPDVATHDVTRDNVINMVSTGRFLSFTTETALGRAMPGVILREVYEASGQTHHIDYAGYWRTDNARPTLTRLLKLLAERYPG